MRSLRFHDDAGLELRAAVRWYETQRVGLGSQFRDEVDAAVEQLLNSPGSYAAIDKKGTRRCRVRRFPYSIYFLEKANGEIHVVAIAHHSRRERYWSRRKLT